MPRDHLPAEFKPKFLDSLDGRTKTAQLLRARLAELQDDLGGEPALSYAKKSLARRAIWLESFLETCEAEAAAGGEPNIGAQIQALNSLVGLFRSLGLERKAKDVPDLQRWIKDKEAAK